MTEHNSESVSDLTKHTEPKDAVDCSVRSETNILPNPKNLQELTSEVAFELVQILIRKSLHISLAESCTGGLATASIVSVPGSSAILDASVVTYANHAKTRYADVPEETLATYGAVSEQTAGAMARGIAQENGANLGIGISGIAGPGGGTPDKPVGTVCFGIYYRESVSSDPKETLITITKHFGDLGRDNVRAHSVYFALSQALKLLK
ncbi:MAG: CinA family protein [Lachnospiraceae bacterium]|nr:CinA family protein [Lachnospiraceae bacterium]